MSVRGGSLIKFAKNKYSQNGEDGILCEILRRLDLPEPGTFVEFGVGNGRDLSNTLRLAECGWRGLWIEQNEESFGKAKALGDSFGGRVATVYGTVGYEDNEHSLDAFMCRAGMPRVVDFMSIDIDSDDLRVWEALQLHEARVVLIEINSGIPLGEEYVHERGGREGNSWTSMVKLGRDKGYAPVCHTGNIFFVHESLVGRLGLPQGELDNPDSIFNTMWSEWAKGAK